MTGIPRPVVRIDAGRSISVHLVQGVGALAGAVTLAMCWWAGAHAVALVAVAIVLAVLLADPRGAIPGAWLAAVGTVVLISDGPAGAVRPVWVVLTIASVHATLAAAQLSAGLGPRARISRAALRLRARTLWRPQLAAQALGVLAWFPELVVAPWVAVAAVVGAAGLTWLVLARRWES